MSMNQSPKHLIIAGLLATLAFASDAQTPLAAPENALALSDVLKNFPVALLYRQEAAPTLQTVDARTDAATFEHGV